MTRNDLVPPNKTKSTTNDKHHKRSDLLTLSLPNVAKGKFRPHHITGFRLQTQKLDSPYKTPSNTLAVKGLKLLLQKWFLRDH